MQPSEVHPLRVLIAAGGTGGHVYPAIALADAFREQVPRAIIEFAGTRHRLEWHAVPQAGYAIHPIDIEGFQRSLSARHLVFPMKLTRAFLQSWSLVRAFDPHLVVGTGGYVTGPVLWAAARQQRPVFIQEQNAFPGVTNRLLARHARRIYVAFEEACSFFPREKCRVLGNPVRASLTSVDRRMARKQLGIPDDARVLLVFGGSLGSLALNRAMQRIYLSLLEADPNLFILWQTGKRYYEALKEEVFTHPRLRLLPYVDDMARAYAAADLVVSRAGALTCSELLVTGTPALLVPSPHVAASHQHRNAEAMERVGAACMLSEEQLEELGTQIQALFAQPGELERMRLQALQHARPGAARELVLDMLQYLHIPQAAVAS